MRYVLHDGRMPLAEMNGTGDVSRPNVFGPVGLVASGAGNEGYSTFDPSGNAAITDMGGGSGGQYYGYYAYQGFTGDSGYTSAATYNFSGQYGGRTDPETGLVLLGFRYYDPGTGRFLTKDPIGFAGGINLYAYAGNNPVNYVDPLGLLRVGNYEIDNKYIYGAGGAAVGFVVGGPAGAIFVGSMATAG